jgi:hypothetical protein
MNFLFKHCLDVAQASETKEVNYLTMGWASITTCYRIRGWMILCLSSSCAHVTLTLSVELQGQAHNNSSLQASQSGYAG